MDRPHTPTALCSFIGAVNYYQDMWPKRSHILAPISNADAVGKYGDKKKKILFEWSPEMDQASRKMKLLLVTDAMTYYSDHNKPFHIYTDASDFQLGACIMQQHEGKWRLVAYYSRKLTKNSNELHRHGKGATGNSSHL